jgi:ATP-dependent Clp protease adaptor protein ClpS
MLIRPIAGRRDALIRLARQGTIAHAKGGLADAPVLSPSLPAAETSKLRKRPPIYKVMLHNDNYNRREYVVKVLIKVVEGFTVEDAMQVMEEAHETGVAMVLACPQDEAEEYCENLRTNGLASSIEPGC